MSAEFCLCIFVCVLGSVLLHLNCCCCGCVSPRMPRVGESSWECVLLAHVPVPARPKVGACVLLAHVQVPARPRVGSCVQLADVQVPARPGGPDSDVSSAHVAAVNPAHHPLRMRPPATQAARPVTHSQKPIMRRRVPAFFENHSSFLKIIQAFLENYETHQSSSLCECGWVSKNLRKTIGRKSRFAPPRNRIRVRRLSLAGWRLRPGTY